LRVEIRTEKSGNQDCDQYQRKNSFYAMEIHSLETMADFMFFKNVKNVLRALPADVRKRCAFPVRFNFIRGCAAKREA